MFAILRFMIVLYGLTFTGTVSATPTQLTEAQFAAQITGLPTIVETFDGFPLGFPDSPFTIANGTYSGSPQISFGGWCILSQCMDANFADGIFNGFPAGTKFWSTRIIYASDGDILRVTVTGNSGVLQVDLPPEGWVPAGVFVGFSDSAGLDSIVFQLIQGQVNYSFDNVTTAGAHSVAPPVISVPTLSGWGMILLVTLMALGVYRTLR